MIQKLLLCFYCMLLFSNHTKANDWAFFKKLQGHQSEVTYLAFNTEKQLLVSGDMNGKLIFWNPNEGRQLHSTHYHSKKITDIQFDPQQKVMAVASYDGKITLWDIASRRRLKEYKLPSVSPYSRYNGNEPTFVRFSADGQTLYFGGYNRKITKVNRADDTTEEIYYDAKNAITTAVITPDNRFLAFGNGGTISFIDLSTHQIDTSKTIGNHNDISQFVCELAVVPDKDILAVWQWGGHVKFWKHDTKEMMLSIKAAQQDGTSSISFSNNSKYMLTGNKGKKASIWKQDTNGMKIIQRIGEHTGETRVFTFNETANLIATGSEDHSINIWKRPTTLDLTEDFTLNSITFNRSDTTFVNPVTATNMLNQLVRALEEHPTVNIQLSGHTDNTGPAYRNLHLSQQRVDAIKNYLLKKGISASRIRTRGYGEQRPIAPNDTEENRSKNRRVEVQII